MGIEDYRVSLRSRAEAEAVREWVRRYPNTAPDDGLLPHADYFRIDTGHHVLEVEVSRADPAEVCVRFMLCNPPSVEAAFLDIVRELVVAFGMEIHDQEAALGGPWWLPPEAFERFAESTRNGIPRRRSEWVAHFGPEQFPAGADEAGRWMIDRAGAVPPVLAAVRPPKPPAGRGARGGAGRRGE